MSFLWSKVVRNAALRVSAITGATAALKQTAFTTAPLTTAEVSSVDFPLAAIQDAAISNVARIIRTYANLRSHPFRNFNLSQTANVAHKGAIPSVNSASKPIIGVYGAIRDATTGDVLTEQPKQVVERIVDNTDDFLKSDYYYYKIIDGRIYHTRDNVKIDVCTFDEATERAALASGNCPLPDAMLDLAWAGTVSLLMIDDSFVSQAQIYENYVQNALSQLASGAIDFLPAPAHINTSAPGVS